MTINVSEMNRRVVLESYTYTQGDAGGSTPVLAESVTVWAKVEQKGGSMSFTQSQLMADATYQITMRYRSGVTTNWNVVYEGQTFMINKIVTDTEGYKRYMILDCSVSIAQQSWS